MAYKEAVFIPPFCKRHVHGLCSRSASLLFGKSSQRYQRQPAKIFLVFLKFPCKFEGKSRNFKKVTMERIRYIKEIEDQFAVHPICAILGPRQVGKMTLAKMYAEKHLHTARFFDLEDPADLVALENPMTVLSNISQRLIVIDEIQRRPNLFPVLRVIVDKFEEKHKFLILGSASRDLIRQSSETLAGRIGYIELPPFSLFETKDSSKLWLRGGFPRSYLARTNDASYLWRQSYITTFLENDIPNLGFQIPPQNLRRFWLMLAHYHVQIFNASELSKSLELSDHTVRRYLDILSGTFMIRIVPAWFENLPKRQVKSPKIYFRDSGILHALLGIKEMQELQRYPRLGSFWEGFALEEIVRTLTLQQGEYYFWSTHAHAELDLFVIKHGKRLGFEFKYGDEPRTTKSMHIALEDLKLDHLGIIYPGNKIFPISDKISVYGLETIETGEFLSKLTQQF
jgi:predicted AAA+ superfamily ATPase